MGKLQRRKGANGEREIINILKENDISAKRISMQETGGIDKGDIELSFNNKIVVGQVKRGQHIPIWNYKSMISCDLLFFRRDNKKWMVTMKIDDFIKIYEKQRNS